MKTCILATLMVMLLASTVLADNENWIKIATWGSRQVFYDKNSVKIINPDEKEVVYCVIDASSTVINQIRINKKSKQSAMGRSEGRKYDKKVSDFDFSKSGWLYAKIKPKTADDILLRKLWAKSNPK